MANACCIIAFDNQGTVLCTLGILQSENIGQDIYCKLPNIGNREVDYILYTDKCGCACCLSNENEIIIHTTQGEIKTLSATAGNKRFTVKWSEIFGGNRYKTMVRYNTGNYPTSITNGTLLIEELTQNQYCNNGITQSGLTGGTTYYIKAFALDNNNNIIASKCTTVTPTTYQTTCWGYTGAVQTTTLYAGSYKLEVRGAQGGGYGSYQHGGKGGYSQGCITLNTDTCIYLYVGGVGPVSPTISGVLTGGWNGGGNGYGYNGGENYQAAGGGGGTDIRIGGNTLYHRRIVAGGGGGATSGSDGCTTCGGVGGGCCGRNSYNYNCTVSGGGTQTSGGTKGGSSCCSYQCNGSFGCGGNGCCCAAAGGGGGWYGGGASSWRGAGGGSGYVYNSSTCGNAPSSYCHNTAYFLTNASTCCGACSFPTPAGGVETGHSGCGCIKITPL